MLGQAIRNQGIRSKGEWERKERTNRRGQRKGLWERKEKKSSDK